MIEKLKEDSIKKSTKKYFITIVLTLILPTDWWEGLTMPAIASLEDLKAAQKDLLEAKDVNELKAVFKKWRSIGWKNVCGAPQTSALRHT